MEVTTPVTSIPPELIVVIPETSIPPLNVAATPVMMKSVVIPLPPPPDAVTVTIPAESADTERLFPKLIVPAVPVSYTHLRAHET